MSTPTLPTPYQQQIHKTKYARWNAEVGKREEWSDTVSRYMDYMKKHVIGRHGDVISEDTWDSIEDNIGKLDVLPSMRALMTAGPALERDEAASYNCSYLAINRVRAFDEAMYILMCGVGVGFSVERKYVNELPVVPKYLTADPNPIVVEDSKYGWADALRVMIEDAYGGRLRDWDVSKVRPAGAILKTFGGRASGPEPLVQLFTHIHDVFVGAMGRQLSSKEVHSIMCKIGDVVVVGGVRRSALISLSDPDDEDMRFAKSGQWWEENPHFALANNSAVWHERPERHVFDAEWDALVASGSGERGFINRSAMQKKVQTLPNRRVADFGINPCVTEDSWVLTSDGPRQVRDLVGLQHSSIVNGQEFKTSDKGFWSNGTKSVVLLTTVEGHQLRLTADHKVLTEDGWKEAGTLTSNDRAVLHDHNDVSWDGKGTFLEGWMLGELIGDGNFSGNLAQLKFWGDSKEEMRELAVSAVHSEVGGRSDLTGTLSSDGSHYIVQSSKLKKLASDFGVVNGEKAVSPEIEKASSDFYAGFIRGLFDADGSVQGNHKKGVSIRLAQADVNRLRSVQRMLLRMGIVSKIYTERVSEGPRSLPDGKGGSSEYWCQAMHELVISGQSMVTYDNKIGFTEPAKESKLRELLSSYKRKMNQDKFYARVESVLPDGEAEVFDCTVPGPEAFDANGLYVHNCAEIILRDRQFCNLSQVTVRADDTDESLAEKVRVAALIGTIQSTLTDFTYLTDEWKKNCDEERLLGVGFTGIMDSELLNGAQSDEVTEHRLAALRDIAREANAELADLLGINHAAAITCVKPAGNSTQLVGAHGSGLHPAYAEYYIRTNRGSKNDPVAQTLYYQGVVAEDEKFHPDTTWVFSYPMKAPANAILRKDRTAIEQLNHWKLFADSWCDHNPSITVNVKHDEWEEVGNWVYENFDHTIGISFLPESDVSYSQMPYQEISKEEYEKLVTESPATLNWDMLLAYETDDQTEGSQELACVSGACET